MTRRKNRSGAGGRPRSIGLPPNGMSGCRRSPRRPFFEPGSQRSEKRPNQVRSPYRSVNHLIFGVDHTTLPQYEVFTRFAWVRLEDWIARTAQSTIYHDSPSRADTARRSALDASSLPKGRHYEVCVTASVVSAAVPAATLLLSPVEEVEYRWRGSFVSMLSYLECQFVPVN